MAKNNRGPVLYLYSWLVPGVGFYLNGFRAKGGLIFVLITGTFLAGLLMGGGVFCHSDDLISRVSALVKLGAGLPWLAGLAPGLRYTRILSPLGEIGSCFASVAGLLNMLAVLSSGDSGKKRG